MAIGQGFNLVTPVQMLGLISAVANGGTRHKPLVIRRIEFPDGSPVEEQEPVSLGTLPASKNTLRIVKKCLRDAVNKPTGTGWIARVAGMDVAGKTGTAQVVGMPDDDDKKKNAVESIEHYHRDHGWFVAFAPAKEPRVAVAVLIEHGGHGSTSAAPIAREMIRTYLEVN